MAVKASSSGGNFERLLGLLERDPRNAALLIATVAAALDEDRAGEAEVLMYRRSKMGPLSPALEQLHGVVLMRVGRCGEAASIFRALLADEPEDATLSLNLALALACRRDYAAADAALTDAVTAEIAEAALLKVRMMQRQGLLEEALAQGRDYLDLHDDNRCDLLGALSSVAFDLRDMTLARELAINAGDNADALSTIGLLLLIEYAPEAAAHMFDRALACEPKNARAMFGAGLSLLTRGDIAGAVSHLDSAVASSIDDGITLLASAWAHLLAADEAASRDRFERALAIDAMFAEAQGGLAVLDVVQGDLPTARRRIEAAFGLDRRCMDAALADTLLLNATGQPHAAKHILQAALNLPIEGDGRTLAQNAVSLGLSAGLSRWARLRAAASKTH